MELRAQVCGSCTVPHFKPPEKRGAPPKILASLLTWLSLEIILP
jgi:hypothetical protein